jgi:hypothetical protein
MFAVSIAFFMLFAQGCGSVQAQNSGRMPEAAVASNTEQEITAVASADYLAFAETIKVPSQPLKEVFVSDGYTIDLTNRNEGYITVSSDNVPDKKIKVLVSKDDQKYYYDFTNQGAFTTYPLQLGDGIYKIAVFENVEDDKYALVASTETDVNLQNEFDPYLIPSQIVDYSKDSKAVYESFLLCNGTLNDLSRVAAIYGYIVDNIAYDTQKAANLSSGYLPNIDNTLSDKQGICYDYSALLACMLRAENIPTRLVMGYVSGYDVYHAWNEIYITDVGWVRAAIYFDGQSWQILDSTFGAADGGSFQNADGDSKYTKLKWY